MAEILETFQTFRCNVVSIGRFYTGVRAHMICFQAANGCEIINNSSFRFFALSEYLRYLW